MRLKLTKAVSRFIAGLNMTDLDKQDIRQRIDAASIGTDAPMGFAQQIADFGGDNGKMLIKAKQAGTAGNNIVFNVTAPANSATPSIIYRTEDLINYAPAEEITAIITPSVAGNLFPSGTNIVMDLSKDPKWWAGDGSAVLLRSYVYEANDYFAVYSIYQHPTESKYTHRLLVNRHVDPAIAAIYTGELDYDYENQVWTPFFHALPDRPQLQMASQTVRRLVEMVDAQDLGITITPYQGDGSGITGIIDPTFLQGGFTTPVEAPFIRVADGYIWVAVGNEWKYTELVGS